MKSALLILLCLLPSLARAQFGAFGGDLASTHNPVRCKLDAQTITNGNGSLPVWHDVSNNGNDFAGTGIGAWVLTNSINGFTSITGALVRTGFLMNQPGTIVIVVKSAIPNATLRAWVGANKFLIYGDSSSATRLTAYNNSENATTASGSYTAQLPFVYICINERGSNPRQYANAVLKPNTISSWTTFPSFYLNDSQTMIGWSTIGAFPMNGSIGEIQFINRPLGDREIVTLTWQLRNKWGI